MRDPTQTTTMTEEESFKVTDRRGRPRETDRAAAETPPSAESRPPLVGVPGGEPSAPPGAAADQGLDLQGLFMMFASSALINLGEAADPVTGETHVDLDQAQETIDMLLLLREKTRGNRTEQENRLLEEILYDLQMRFVRATEGRKPR